MRTLTLRSKLPSCTTIVDTGEILGTTASKIQTDDKFTIAFHGAPGRV